MNCAHAVRNIAITLVILLFNLNSRADVVYATTGAGHNVYRIAPDGTATTFATFSQNTNGLAVDPQGNLFVALGDAGMVDKVTPAGAVSTFATGLGNPDGLAFDHHGNLYASGLGHIDVIAPDGSVKPFYTFTNHGSGQLAFDAADNLFVVSNSGNDITKITPGGQASTFTKITGPLGVAVDSAGNIYANEVIQMGQISSGQIVRFTPSGTPTVVAMMGTRGMAIGSNDTLYYSSGDGIHILAPDGQSRLFASLPLSDHIALQVPEPSSSFLVIAAGCVAVGYGRRRRFA